jgi:pimeloyl-ACP methyl ester carboxylesterase
MRRACAVAVAVALVVMASCTSGSDHDRRAGATRTAAGASASRGPALAPCTERGDLLCGSVEVPLDRANPDAGTIEIGFLVHRHTDTTVPPAEPVFATPGGPGSGGLDAMDMALGIDAIVDRHDIVAIDPRGTGRSGAIDCPDLQNGWDDTAELQAAVQSCGDQLGGAADRYGAGDVAMDVDAVRRALGYDRIDYYAFSYGTVPEQAYAVRFPERLHAMVLDAGFAVTDPEHRFAWSLGAPLAMVREAALMCRRAPECHVANPAGAVRWLVRRVAARPLRGRVHLPGGPPRAVLIDEAEVANILKSTGTCLMCGQIDSALMLNAVAGFRRGNPDDLLRIADQHPRGPFGRAPDPAVYSDGDNIAAFCNDQDFVWDRSDPIDVRRREFRAALAALPDDAFAPFSRRGWNTFAWPGGCLRWPAPDRFEPVLPAGAQFPDVPALILAGDSDTVVPPELVETLHDELPHANFVTVAGAAHPVAGPARRDCASELIGQLFETLRVTDASCAVSPEE